ncbi:hypothetical protein NEOLI_004339 [Neolecta irregularis DAH-3]|uniref:Uncharacterized protein n=1 Tax=Neolecta irregularis (strain DAH-3) TaxID=1198029 RepID=A0A1U7LMN6_NEOID|nr:hypothetical protein NEOLI_004339 [Neolecta irregularis DAH-3]|eukprot:OLL23843.1 hypothetical protein NEOLI_004339 [Neolecta irregularis DAH-3]
MRSVDRLSLIIWLEGLVATLAESHHASLGNCIDVSCRLLDYAFNDLNSTPGQFITLEPSSTFLRTIELVQTVYLSFLGFVGVVGDSSEKTFLQLFQDQVQIGIHDALQQPVATTQSTDSIVRLYESLRKSFPLSVLDKQSNAPNSSQPLLLHPENIGLSESKIRNMDILGWHQDGFVVITPTNLWTQHLETTVANGMLTIYIYNTLSPVFRLFNYHRISSLKALENSTQVTHLCSIGQSLDTTTRLLFHTTSSRKWAADHGIATVELTVNVQDASLRPIENTPPANLIYRRLQILQYVLGHPVMCIVRDIYVRSHAAPLSSYTTIILGLFGLVVLIARSVLQGYIAEKVVADSQF